MIPVTASTRIYLYRGAADMRKSFDGLCGLVRSQLGEDPISGALFVFCNRRRNLIKILYWDRDGFAIWYKRLEKGTFRIPTGDENKMEIDRRELAMLLEGVIPRYMSPRYRQKHTA